MLAQIETDKVTIDVKYTEATPGVVSKVLVKEDDTVEVGQECFVVDVGASGGNEAAGGGADKEAPKQEAALPKEEKKEPKKAEAPKEKQPQPPPEKQKEAEQPKQQAKAPSPPPSPSEVQAGVHLQRRLQLGENCSPCNCLKHLVRM